MMLWKVALDSGVATGTPERPGTCRVTLTLFTSQASAPMLSRKSVYLMTSPRRTRLGVWPMSR